MAARSGARRLSIDRDGSGTHGFVPGEFAGLFEQFFGIGGRERLGGRRVVDAASAGRRQHQRRHRCRVGHFADQGEIVLAEREVQLDQSAPGLFAQLGYRVLAVFRFGQSATDVLLGEPTLCDKDTRHPILPFV